jgi:hypothetical protein
MTPQECDRELVALRSERAALVRRQRRGETGLQDALDRLAECIAYTNAAWTRARWPRYFRPHEGAIHRRARCNGLKRQAPLVPALSGVSDLGVVASYGRLCRHCILDQPGRD